MFSTAVIVFAGLLASPASAQEGDERIVQEIGGNATIPANFNFSEGERLASLTWKRGDDVIVRMALGEISYDDPKALLDSNDYALILTGLEFSDTEVYTINAVTTGDAYEKSRTLEVLASPDVSTRVLPVLDAGTGEVQDVAECIAKGGSDPFTIEWYDENDRLVENATSSVDSQNAEYDFLFDSVLPLSMAVDATIHNGRTFTCVVIDALGRRIEREASLEVTEPTTTVPTTTMQAYPMITKFPNQDSITLVVGNSRTVTCRATGVPEPTVTWYKDDTEIKSQQGESRLEIVAEDYSKRGTYRCEAVNVEGTDSDEVTIDVQGPPVIPGIDSLVNETETYLLNSDADIVQLECRSDAYPVPDIIWSAEGFDFSQLDTTSQLISGDGTVVSYLNISAGHFLSDNPVTKIACTALNDHGNARKSFVISAPVAVSNTGMIVGIVVAVLLLIVPLIGIAIFCYLAKKRRTLTANPEDGGLSLLSPCCVGSNVKSKELNEESDGVKVEHVKEIGEEGTHEEKQKLTEAEEGPAKENDKNDEKDGDEGDEEKEEKPKTNKRKIPLPMQCCKGEKEEKTAENEEADGEGDEQGKEPGNGDTKTGEETERDSGKGDTLEKVIEDDAK